MYIKSDIYQTLSKTSRTLVTKFPIASRKWDNIPYIRNSSSQKDNKVECQTKSTMFDCSMSTQIQVPLILLT